MTETFRLGKSTKYQGMFFIAVSLAAMMFASTPFFLEDPASQGYKGEHSVAIVGGFGLVVTGGFLLLSLYIWASYHVERFTVSGSQISNRSVFQDHQFDVSDLESLKWRTYPVGGSILFRGLRVKSRLDLHAYAKTDRLRIIQVLHDIVPAAVQEGWPEFCHRLALPLRDGSSPLQRGAAPSECITITRARYDRMLPFALAASILVAVSLWAWTHLWTVLLVPSPLVIAFWLLLRFNVPPEGRVEQRAMSMPRGRAMLATYGIFGLAMFVMVGLKILGVEKSIAEWIGCGLMGLALVPLFFYVHKIDKQQRAANEQGARTAPDRWLHGG